MFWQSVSSDRDFSDSVPVGRCMDGGIAIFPAERSRATAICLAERSCGALLEQSYHDFSGRGVPVGGCRDGAITNFLAESSCGSL